MLDIRSKQTLRNAGLIIANEPDFPEEHVAWPSGYAIAKPASVEGNGHEWADSIFYNEEDEEIKCVSPVVFIWKDGSKWSIEVSEYAPGPGPSDFKESFSSQVLAVERILSYFFDPEDPKFKVWYEKCEASRLHWEGKGS